MAKKHSYILVYTTILGVSGLALGSMFRGPSTFAAAMRPVYAQNPGAEAKISPSLDLGFERKGKVARVLIKVGDRVKPGDVLIELDRAELLAQLHEADAAVQIQQAKLRAINGTAKVGTSGDKGARIKRDAAEDAFEDAKIALVDAIQDAYTKADDAVRNKIDVLFLSPRSNNPRLNAPPYIDSQTQIDLMNKRVVVERLLTDWGAVVNALVPTDAMSGYTRAAKRNLVQIRSLLDDITALMDNIVTDSTYSATTIRNWRTDISSARTNIGTAIKGISSADAKVRETRAKLTLAEDDLANLRTPEPQVAQQEGALRSVQARKELIEVQIGKMRLTAPVAGRIVRQNAQIGTLILNSAPIVSLMPDR